MAALTNGTSGVLLSTLSLKNQSPVFGLDPDGRAPSGEYGFAPTEQVKFGPGSVAGLAAEVDRLGGRRVLLVTGTTLATRTDLVNRLADLLGDRFVGAFGDTRQHAPREAVVAAAAAARECEADCLVSFGGGSPIDTAKLVALCLAAGVDEPGQMGALHVREVGGEIQAPDLPDVTIPHIAISTTLSAGEFTRWAGATDTGKGIKHAYGAPGMTPRCVFLDPELAVATPKLLWGSTGLKAFDHAVETVCSSRPQPFADALALRAIEMLAGALVAAAEDPGDVDLRGLCQVAAWMSIASLSSVPLGLSHALGHQLGARCDVPHGVTSCIVLPRVMEFNRPVGAHRQRLVAEAMQIDVNGIDDDTAAAAAGAKLREIVSALGVETRLREWGVSDADLVAIAEDATEDFMSLTNPRKIEGTEEVLALLRGAY